VYLAENTADGTGMAVVDVSDRDNPAQVGGVGTWAMDPSDIALSSNLAIVTSPIWNNCFKIFDIANSPAYPELLSNNCDFGPNIKDVVISGSYAYMALSNATIVTVDISDPTNPRVVGNIEDIADRMVVQGKYLYIIYFLPGDGGPDVNEFRIIDISKPSEPVLVSYLELTGNEVVDLAVNGRYAYVLGQAETGSPDIKVIDVADAENPLELNVVDSSGTGASEIVLGSRYLYLNNSEVWDIANPASPTLVTTFPYSYHRAAISGRYLYAIRNEGFGETRLIIQDIPGIETSALVAHTAEAGLFSVLGDADIYNDLTVGGSMNIGPGGILSEGALAVSSPDTTSTFVFSVSTTNLVVSNRLTVSGRDVCLADGTNCSGFIAPEGAYVWTDDAVNNRIYPTTSTRDIMLGGLDTVSYSSLATTTVVTKMISPIYTNFNHTGLMVFRNRDNAYLWGQYNLRLCLEKIVANVGTQAVACADVAPSPLWLRVRVDSARVSFDYSTDGINYVNTHSQALEFVPLGIGIFKKRWSTGANITQSYDYFSINGVMADNFNDGVVSSTWVTYTPSGSIVESDGQLNIINGGDWFGGATENAPYAYIPYSSMNGLVAGKQFVFDSDTNTSTVVISSGNSTDFYVGTTTYGGGLSSRFAMETGDDWFVQGQLGSVEGLFSATGVTVGTGTTVYGDGNLLSSAADYEFKLSDAGSSWKFGTLGGVGLTVASTGNIGIGVVNPGVALDVAGSLSNAPAGTNGTKIFRIVKTHSEVTNNTEAFDYQNGYVYTFA
jgi:hypothetical protein